jgi:hypothetical protein
LFEGVAQSVCRTLRRHIKRVAAQLYYILQHGDVVIASPFWTSRKLDDGRDSV